MLISCLHTPHITLNSLQPIGPQPFGKYTSECSGSISAYKFDVWADERIACVKPKDLTCDGLKQKLWNVVALDQSACWRASERVAPNSNAFDVDAPLIEWAEYLVISIPALARVVFTQWAMLHALTGAWEQDTPRKSWLSSNNPQLLDDLNSLVLAT